MRQFITILLISACLGFGCTAIKQAKVDATACLQDDACRAEAVAEAEKAKSIAVDLSGASPIPLSSNVVGAVAYGGVLLFALVKHGRRKKEQESSG